MLKKLGVIGGMGPEATSYFYQEMIKHTEADCDQKHIDMVILSHATMPDRTKAILTGKHQELLASMQNDVSILQACGVSHIAIPCNTSHYFYDQIQSFTSVPVINMVQESVRAAADYKPNVQRIGIMGTDGTIRAGVYAKECEKLGIKPVIPSPDRQKDVMSLIYDDIKKGMPGDPHKFERAFKDLLDQKCDVIILACTEISVFKKENIVPDICLDAMDILVKESIIRSGANYLTV